MIRTSTEAARGCGYRVPGGLYLVAGELTEPCPRLPLPLDRCPHCGQGIGPARGWTWITPSVLFPAQEHGTVEHNAHCPLGRPTAARLVEAGLEPLSYHRTGERAGLIWVGEKFYSTPDAFMDEAAQMGVSRRIKAVPMGFEIGKDWVYLGHRKAINAVEVTGDPEDPDARDTFYPGVITLFKPTAIEYVVKGTETQDELDALEKRGISLVKVERAEEPVS